MTGWWLVAFVGLWAVVILVASAVVGVLLKVQPILEQAASRAIATNAGPQFGRNTGEVVPAFEARDRNGKGIGSRVLLSKGASLFLFVGPNCSPCVHLVSDMIRDGWDSALELVLVSPDADSARVWLRSIPTNVSAIFEGTREVSQAFATDVTPNAILLGSNGIVIAQSIPASWSALQSWAAAAPGGARQEVVETGTLPTMRERIHG
jgi:hypothetical protein